MAIRPLGLNESRFFEQSIFQILGMTLIASLVSIELARMFSESSCTVAATKCQPCSSASERKSGDRVFASSLQ